MSPLLTKRPQPALRAAACEYQRLPHLKLLEERGYKQHTIRPDSLLLANLDDWLVRKGHRVIDLNETMLGRLLRYHIRRRHSRRQAA